MKKTRTGRIVTSMVLIVLITVLGVLSSGCHILLMNAAKKTETSEKYLVGFDFGSYADVFGMAPVIDCAVRYDKSVDAFFAWQDPNGERVERVLNFKLTDDQYYDIERQIDPREVFALNPKCSDPASVCDGGDSWLYVYGPDDSILKACGGFCPRSERFHEIRRILFDNVPDELKEVYSQYEDIYMTGFEGADEAQLDEQFRTLFDVTCAQYLEA